MKRPPGRLGDTTARWLAAALAAALVAIGGWFPGAVCADASHHADAAAADLTVPIERTAATHPMRYWVSRPAGWSTGRRWPVLLVIPGAERQFLAATREFATARGQAQFLIVTPLVLTAGGTAQDHREAFDYPDAAWERAAHDGNCTFDREGLDAVLADVMRLDAADSVVMLAAFEAGGHVAWAELFSHPQRIVAAALVTPNYNGRCVDEAQLPDFAGQTLPPVRAFSGSRDTLWTNPTAIHGQWDRARTLALAHGFQSLSEIVVPDVGHEWMAPELLKFLVGALRH